MVWWVLTPAAETPSWGVLERLRWVLLTVIWVTCHPTQVMKETDFAFGVQNPKL